MGRVATPRAAFARPVNRADLLGEHAPFSIPPEPSPRQPLTLDRPHPPFQKPTGPSGLDTELAFNDEGGHVLGDLPSSAMKAAGEPIVVGLGNEIVGKAAVTAATEAVNHARQRIDMVRPSCSRVPREDIFGFRQELSSPAGVCRSDAPHARAFRPPPASVGSDVPSARGSFRSPDASTIPRACVSRFHPRVVWTAPARGIPRRRRGRRLGPPRVGR